MKATEKQREAARRWNAAHPEKIREYQRKWHADHKDKAREWNMRWRKGNLEHYNECRRRSIAIRMERNGPNEELREWRKENGLTQKKAAEIFGYCETTISNWENGKDLAPDFIMEYVRQHPTIGKKASA